ncbi:hypothetical protein ACEQ8H_002277 [Pleosporales sp. CAS-2024a]
MKFIAGLATFAAAMAVTVPTQVLPRNNPVPHQDDPAFISAVMRAHWYWRRLHCAQDLVWDADLASAARADVDKCPDTATHERPSSNLSSTGPPPDDHDAWVEFARTAVHGWHDEETQYPYDNPHYDSKWGHFTQMVWRNSSTVGCALGNCPSAPSFPGRIYCYYMFYGNNVAEGQFKAQVWPPVCKDPAVSEVMARSTIDFDWTARAE